MNIELKKPSEEMPPHDIQVLLWAKDPRWREGSEPEWFIGYLYPFNTDKGDYFINKNGREVDVIYWAYLEEPEL